MEPEIARRCASCGAAVRGQAKFCPQCGAGMDAPAAAARQAEAAPAEGTPVAPPPAADEKPAADVVNRTRAFSGEEYLALSDELARQRARAREVDENHRATVLPDKQQQADLRAVAAQVRIKMQAKENAPGQPAPTEPEQPPAAQEGATAAPERARAERLRGPSFVLLDEAQSDPTLRFVLAAIVLFVLFLLILLFSHILG